MSNTASTTLTRAQKQAFACNLYDRDHQPVPLSQGVFSSSDPSKATIGLDPADATKALITGLSPGGCSLTVQESPSTNTPLVISVTVLDTPNQSEVTAGAFDAPVSRF